MENQVIQWLLEGDVSIQYQVHRDLLGQEKPKHQNRIPNEGWGKAYLEARHDDGHWGREYYMPKWTSTHYTLFDLRNLCMPQNHPLVQESIWKAAENEKGKDGGINPARTVDQSDVCVNGMFLNFAAYFGLEESKLQSTVDLIIDQKMPDGGFNCRLSRYGAKHSSMHTTINTIEGIGEYLKQGYDYRREELKSLWDSSVEFLLVHELFKSDRTGKLIHPGFLRMPYPDRWHYTIIRALDCFRAYGLAYDRRMQGAIDFLIGKRGKDGLWKLHAQPAGDLHFEMEKAGAPSRWNTLRMLRILRAYA